eukprot:7133281-Prymnesium_polylepis.1
MKHALQLVHVWHLPPPAPSWNSEGGRWSHVTAIGRRRVAWPARHEGPRAGTFGRSAATAVYWSERRE